MQAMTIARYSLVSASAGGRERDYVPVYSPARPPAGQAIRGPGWAWMAALAWYLPPFQKHKEGHDGDADGGDDGADVSVCLSVCLSACLSVCQAPDVDMDDDEQVDSPRCRF